MGISFEWEKYFGDLYEGIGTTYERCVLHRYFENIKKEYAVRTLLEAPSFGMTGISGINSMWWAARGVEVTIVDDNIKRLRLAERVWMGAGLRGSFVLLRDFDRLPFESGAFDLGWNFASLCFVRRLPVFLEELTRVTKNAVFFCIPNRVNVFNLIKMVLQGEQDFKGPANVNPWRIRKIMSRLGFQLADEGFLDVPPWPDIAMKKEDLLRIMGFEALAKKLERRQKGGRCILDFYSGKDPDLETDVLRYSFLEHLPNAIKRLWAHHHYFVFAPNFPMRVRQSCKNMTQPFRRIS